MMPCPFQPNDIGREGAKIPADLHGSSRRIVSFSASIVNHRWFHTHTHRALDDVAGAFSLSNTKFDIVIGIRGWGFRFLF